MFVLPYPFARFAFLDSIFRKLPIIHDSGSLTSCAIAVDRLHGRDRSTEVNVEKTRDYQKGFAMRNGFLGVLCAFLATTSVSIAQNGPAAAEARSSIYVVEPRSCPP